MEQQPVDINLESKEIRKNELHSVGDRVERAVINGETTLLPRDEILWLRVMVERTGLNLDAIVGRANLAEQAGQLVAAIGAERLQRMMPELMVEIIDNPEGEVFKGEEEKSEDVDKEIRDFVTSFLTKQIVRGEFVFDPKSCAEEWQKNTVYRLEAVMSVMNKLLWVMQSEEEPEDYRRQGTEGVLKHFRERVMRGAERAGETIDPKAVRSDEKIIRFLPPKSIGVILEHLTRL